MKRFVIAAVATLAAVLGAAAPAQATPFTGAGSYYAGGSQTMSGTDYSQGLSGKLYVAKPFVEAGAFGGLYSHSLAELAVESTSGANPDTIEFGWTVDRNVNGDTNPHLFGYTWKAGVPQCYNTCGFVDNASNPINLGSDISADIGTAKLFQVFWSASACGPAASGWYLYYNGTSVGCYYAPVAVSAGYTTAKFVQAFGEYHYNGVNNSGTSNDKPCGDMGNGTAPGTGAAYISSLSLAFPSPSTLPTSFTLFSPTDSAAYNATWVVPTSPGTSFYYGGAGYKFVSGVATTPGNVGSC